MRVVIPAVGTRGDVQPYISLGIGLRDAGHEVCIATLSAFESFVTGEGLEFAPLRAEFLELLNTPEGKKALAAGNPLGVFKKVMPMLRAVLDVVHEASDGAHVMVYQPKTRASEGAGYRISPPHASSRCSPPKIISSPKAKSACAS